MSRQKEALVTWKSLTLEQITNVIMTSDTCQNGILRPY